MLNIIMPNYNIKISNGDRSDIISYIMNKKSLGVFKVVDVGGSLGGWSANVTDAIIDFNDPIIVSNSQIKHFKCDITDHNSWSDILKYIEENGKFDFCICTHTLEDIMNPVFVSNQITKIAKSGYIAVPSKYRELSRFECGNTSYRGYIHHRWIFDITADNIFMGYPKINYLDSTNIFDKIANMDHNKCDLSFFWEENIDITYINNNYLGPNISSVINYYNNLLI
jgi:hypothetical protein